MYTWSYHKMKNENFPIRSSLVVFKNEMLCLIAKLGSRIKHHTLWIISGIKLVLLDSFLQYVENKDKRFRKLHMTRGRSVSMIKLKIQTSYNGLQTVIPLLIWGVMVNTEELVLQLLKLLSSVGYKVWVFDKVLSKSTRQCALSSLLAVWGVTHDMCACLVRQD